MFIQIIFSFFVSGCTSILNNIQKKYFFLCGFSGIITALSYNYLNLHNNAAVSSLLACLVLTICSQIFSHITKMPSTIFTIPGIMPIVPGGLLFKSLNYLVQNDYNHAISFATQTILVGFSIAIGFLINEVLSSIMTNIKNSTKKLM